MAIDDKKVRLTIPAGVENGQVIKIKGKGGKGVNGGPNGDLYIKFIINNHSKFKRVGNDLFTDLELDHRLSRVFHPAGCVNSAVQIIFT